MYVTLRFNYLVTCLSDNLFQLSRSTRLTHNCFMTGTLTRKRNVDPQNSHSKEYNIILFGQSLDSITSTYDVVILLLLPTCKDEESSHLAFSAASLSRCRAIWSFVTSIPVSLLNSATRNFRSVLSKSSPPRNVSPFVDFTSNTPFCISRMEISKVPPPRSYMAILKCVKLL